MNYFKSYLTLFCLALLFQACQKYSLNNIKNSLTVKEANKTGVAKSAIDTFLVFADTSALISTMNDLENGGDSALAAFEYEYNFVSMRKFYEDKLNAATDTFEQNKWEARPVDMEEFATIVSPSGLIQIEDTLYLIDVEGGAMYFTQSINSNTVSLLKSKTVSDPAIDSVHLGHYDIQGLFCTNQSQAPHLYNQEGWIHYMVNGTDYRYKTRLSYNDYGVWFAVITRFRHRKWDGQNVKWQRFPVSHYYTYEYDYTIRCGRRKTQSLTTSTTQITSDRAETLYSHIRALTNLHFKANHYWIEPGTSIAILSSLEIKY